MTDTIRLTSRGELRRRCALRLGDLVQVQGTDTGTEGTLIDSLNIPMGNEDLARRQIVFVSDDFLGLRRSITGTTNSTNTISFTPVLSDVTTVETRAEVYNRWGVGFQINEYDLAINMAQDDAYPVAKTILQSTPATFSSTVGTIAIPNTFREVFGVSYQDNNSVWQVIPKADHLGYDGWWIQPGDGVVSISGYVTSGIDGMSVRLDGYGRNESMNVDWDMTSINPEWIVARACYHLSLMAMGRDRTQDRARQAAQFQGEAMSLRGMIWTRHNPNSVLVNP